MIDWHLGFTALRICKLFAESTVENHCCAEITRILGVPRQTAWNALQSLKDNQIVFPEKEHIMPTQPLRGAGARVFYRLTEQGQSLTLKALAAVQYNGTTILSS